LQDESTSHARTVVRSYIKTGCQVYLWATYGE
jgi:hypothetical protein